MAKNQLSIYHRAFKAYIKELQNAKADQKLHEALLADRAEYKAYLKELQKAEDDPGLQEAIVSGRTGKEYLESTRYSCTIECDWIEKIEFALPYLEKAVMENRAWAAKELLKMGFEMTDSRANFLFAKHPRISGGALYLALRERGVLVRHFEKPRICEYNRITVGSREQMEILIQTIRTILEERL